MTASESHQENGEELFSCTLKNVLMDHFVHLLPVYAGESSTQYNPLSIQCGPREDHVQQSHTHSVPGPSQSIIGGGSTMCDLHGEITSQGQFTCPMGEGDPIGAIQPLSVMGLVKQNMVSTLFPMTLVSLISVTHAPSSKRNIRTP